MWQIWDKRVGTLDVFKFSFVLPHELKRVTLDYSGLFLYIVFTLFKNLYYFMLIRFFSFLLFRNRGEKRMGAFECVRKVYQTDGLRGFYRGMSASYAGISETVIHFVIYESIKQKLLEYKIASTMENEEESVKEVSDFVGMMLAAATSKTCATSIAYPHGRRTGWCMLLLSCSVMSSSSHDSQSCPSLCSLPGTAFHGVSQARILFSSVQFSRSVVSDSLQPHESQHARPPCPSPTPRVHPDSRPLSQWCHPAWSGLQFPSLGDLPNPGLEPTSPALAGEFFTLSH